MGRTEGKTAERTVPVLMYHGVVSSADSVPQRREPGAELYDVPRHQFDRQMRWLSDQGYRGGLLEEEAGNGSPLVVVTFDDGEMNNFTEALPVLKKYGFKAYFFVISRQIGRSGYMGWPELRALMGEGMVIGSHGLTHEILTNITDIQMEEELAASKRHLERNLETEITSLSIPRGFFNEKIIRKAREVGYKHIFISDRPPGLRSACHERLAVKGRWSEEHFVRMLRGETPWTQRVLEQGKRKIKWVLTDTGYNRFRTMVLKVLGS